MAVSVKNKKKLIHNIIALFIVQFLNYVAPLLVFPYLTRVLGVDGFGVVAVMFSLCSIAMIITDYGFGLSAPYWIAKHRDDKVSVSRYIGSVFIIKTILLIVVLLLVFAYLFSTHSVVLSNGYFFCGLFLTIVFQAYQPVWFYQGIEELKNVTLFIGASKLTYLGCIFLFVRDSSDIGGVFMALCASYLVSTIYANYRIYSYGYSISFPKERKLIFEVLKTSGSFFFSRAAVGIYTSASTFIIGTYSGATQAALYSSAEKLYQAGQNATSPLAQALYPYLSRSKDKTTLFRVILYTLPLLISGVGICYFFSPIILRVFYGPDFISASPILKNFLICSVVTFISINIGYPAFSILDRLDVVNKSVYAAACIYIVLLSVMYMNKAINAYNISYCILIVESFVLIFRITAFFILNRKNNAIH
ncbi:polysaccharide biosynthesis protein [Hafnia alvei ATCC 51873]|uniref:Polysaccharide biosynthesis protein n=1 Tax=Hafnia alvei ATCC 51873 TaxID=1002364 RepID=G9Y1F6_HAFAL|nr:polysaccharide biosynthesis protein [Hafnia alvei ATCC 51873]